MFTLNSNYFKLQFWLGSLFGSLPQPRHENNVIEEVQDEFLSKKEIPEEKPKPKIKITLPLLNQYQSDEDEDADANKSQPKKPVVSLSFTEFMHGIL